MKKKCYCHLPGSFTIDVQHGLVHTNTHIVKADFKTYIICLRIQPGEDVNRKPKFTEFESIKEEEEESITFFISFTFYAN